MLWNRLLYITRNWITHKTGYHYIFTNIKMTYNQRRYIQLLKRLQDLKNQGKNLFIENQEANFELSEYNIAIEKHIFWQDRY